MAIPETPATILALVQGNDELSDANALKLYKLVRDQLAYSMHQQEAVTYLEIRNRRVQVSDPAKLLEFLETKLIPMYEDRSRRSSGKSNRNVVRLRKN